ncbi:MAG TPA: YceI family protein [Acidimicrobiales bacterium]|jgi:polyisoprenoid-binding protein YceI|nr:YceI family protein [Acidimicrobiales bacterium]
MTTTTTSHLIPGLAPGTWTIDPAHSEVSFSVRHMMVSKVRGRFSAVEGEIVIGDGPADSSVTAAVDVRSFDTGNADRDAHIRSADFLDAETHPTMTYRSSAVRPDGDGYVVDGELTLRGVTRPVALALEVGGVTTDPSGDLRLGLSATTEINRRHFGIDLSMPLESGGVVVGDKIKVNLDIAAVRPAA